MSDPDSIAAPAGRSASSPHLATMAVIGVGGAAGSAVRYGLSQLWPARPGEVPWVTLGINLLGSLLLGMLIVAVTDIWRPHHLLRPALGTGVLGGFTTFSTFAVELRARIGPDPAVAFSYLALSVLGGVAAAAAGMAVIRRLEPRFEIAESHELVDPFDPDLP
jgi:fluoride exporter